MPSNEGTVPPTFADRIAQRSARMSPAEQRVARYCQDNREEVLLASAAALAAKADTSDATVVRATRALGFSGLAELRRALADELRASNSLADRLTRTLDTVGSSLEAAFAVTVDIHLGALESLRRAITPGQFEHAVRGLAAARRVAVFGIGPSSAIATYFAVQLRRFGLDAITLANTGLLFADDLGRLRPGDLVFVLAYGRVYPELAALLDAAGKLRLTTFLVTDTLGTSLRARVDLVLAVPRGRADLLSMHTATLGFLEALLVGLAALRPEETAASLALLNAARAQLAGGAAGLPAPIRRRRSPRSP